MRVSVTLVIGIVCLLLVVLIVSVYERFPTAYPLSAHVTTPAINSPVTVLPVATVPFTVATSHQVSFTSPTIIDNEWQTFIDSEAGYSIQYPTNFIVRSNRSKGELYNITNITFLGLEGVEGYHAMSIMVDPNPQEYSLEMLYEELHENVLGTNESNTLMQLQVAGITAYQTSLLPGSTDFHILLPYKDRVFHFALVHGLGPIESDSNAKTAFFQILDTFQITNLE